MCDDFISVDECCVRNLFKVLSKELSREIGDCNIMKPGNLLLNTRDTEDTITCLNVCSGIHSDVNSNGTKSEKSNFLKLLLSSLININVLL